MKKSKFTDRKIMERLSAPSQGLAVLTVPQNFLSKDDVLRR